MPDGSGYWIHVCLYSQSATTAAAASSTAPFTNIFSQDKAQAAHHHLEPILPSSLDEIQRKVDRPLDARFSPLSIQSLNLSQKTSDSSGNKQGDSMGPTVKPRKKGSDGLQSPSVPQSPSTPLTQTTTATAAAAASSSMSTTPVARFIKESSFPVDEDSSSRSSGLEVAFGIVHMFRDDAALHESANAKTKTALEDDTGCILAILGVPSHIGPADFLRFIEPATNAISQVRMIREERAQRCMILLKFREASNAEEFYKMYADQPFDSLEDPDELCRVVYVTKVSISTTSTLPYAYPLLANSDPWPIMTNNVISSLPQHTNSNALTQRLIGSVSVELPTCPVCLERMDASVTGLMTVTCQHTFHCSCLSRWSDSRCPVCRYTQSRMIKKGQYATPSFIPEHGCCAVCGTGSDLWVCLICATVGCGRYKAGHAHRHHQETGHLYSLELETQRVWDYAGDGYVHRLIQNKAESKTADEGGPTPASFREQKSLVKGSRQMEASGSAIGQSRPTTTKGDEISNEVEEKMEAIGLEYSHLLSTQLESQRAFYEDQVRVYQRRMEEVERSAMLLKDESEKNEQECKELKTSLESTTSKYNSIYKNLERSLKTIKDLDEDLKGERLMGRGLIGKIERLEEANERSKEEMQSLKMENVELKEQVRDLMIFLETRDTIEKEGMEELRDGRISVGKGKKQVTAAGPPPLPSEQVAETVKEENESKLKGSSKSSKKKRAKGKAKAKSPSDPSSGQLEEEAAAAAAAAAADETVE